MDDPDFSLGNVRDDLLRDGDDRDKLNEFWEDLPLDPYTGDGGTYRHRKYSAITHNRDDGVVCRFEPFEPAFLDTSVLRRTNIHQHRIVAAEKEPGNPTPRESTGTASSTSS